MENVYIVKVSYIKFKFDDRNEAIDFAETAFEKMIDDTKSVEIYIESKEEEKQEGEA